MKKCLLLLCMLFFISLSACSESDSQTFELTQKGNGSAGDYWSYNLSNDTVIKEIDYFETRFFGPGYTQHWKFEIANDGDVTIHWIAYKGGRESEKDSYDITYSINNGDLSIVSE